MTQEQRTPNEQSLRAQGSGFEAVAHSPQPTAQNLAPHAVQGLTIGRLLARPSVQYLLFFVGFGVFLLLWWPITLTDTDLWYHLTSGRYLFEHRAIPHDSFFSFVEPPRAWSDYFWLFQGLVFLIHSWSGYFGLIVLRALAYLAAMVLIIRYFFNGLEERERISWCAFLTVLYALILIPRYVNVRPHIFTYLFIVMFLYLLEHRPEKARWLPALAVLWSNLHGIEYPVMWLITGSYGLEHVLNRLTGRAPSHRAGRRFLPWLILSMAAVCLTPHGLRLLRLPFQSLGYFSAYIAELSSIPLAQVTSLYLSQLAAPYLTIFNLFLFISLLVVIAGLIKRSVRVSHLLLWGGGLILLTTGHRFIYEYVLLSLPLMSANPLCSPQQISRQLPRPACLVLVVVLIVSSILSVKGFFGTRPTYPFSNQGLPEGVITFLNRLGAGGKLLNNPNAGGYLEWRLYPKYRIFMDMEMGPLFRADDFCLAGHVFLEKGILQKVLARYDPSFITVPIDSEKFKDLIKDVPDYALVFFDDAEVLYVSRRRHPDLAARYEMKDVDPFELKKKKLSDLDPDPEKEPVLKHVRALLEVYPDGGLTNLIAGIAYTKSGMYDRAIPHAQTVIRNFPHLAVGYKLLGDALKGLKQFDEASASYRTALGKEGAGNDLHKEIGFIYLEQGRYQDAYRALKQGVDVLSTETSLEDFYKLGSSARLAGNREDAKTVLRYLYEYRIMPDDPEWSEKVKRDLLQLGVRLGD